MSKIFEGWLRAVAVFVCLLAVATSQSNLRAQQANGSIHGTVTDPNGRAIATASVTLEDADGSPLQRGLTSSQGAYTIGHVAPGRYTLAVSATGFATQEQVISATDSEQALDFKLPLASVAEEVLVESEDNTSLAVQSAPVKALLDAGSARTEISSNYIAEYTSPVTDFADIIQAAPGTVSYTTNGIGNGQAKIFFRGFVDDDYTMTWDGVPFNDSNDPSHHSWAYIPAAAVGYVDFDRSPGTASDIGPSNFGGSIHFFSPKMSEDPRVKGEVTYGSWNTLQYLGDISSGAFLNGKAHFWLNGDYQTSDGYQTFSPKQDVAATAKFDYKFSDRSYLSVIGTDIIVDAFTNNDPTRRQLFHHGDNYLYDSTRTNSAYASTSKYYYDPQYYKFSVYHVPSFFDVITFNHDYGKGWKLDTKSYTYGYSNHQHYQNNTDQDLVTDAVLTNVVNEVVGGDDQLASSPYYSKKPTGVVPPDRAAARPHKCPAPDRRRWRVFTSGQQLHQPEDGIRRRAAIQPGVQIAARTGGFQLHVDQPAQPDAQRGDALGEQLGVGNQGHIRLQLLRILLDILGDGLAAHFLLALHQDIRPHRQRAVRLAQRFDGLHVAVHLASLVGRAASVDIAVAHGRLKRRAFP